MTTAVSLRMRLIVIILPPVLVISILAALWQLNNARQTADGVFNKSLLSAAVAVANDVAISGGDALSLRTRDILASTSGGLMFYHVYAPDGVIVAGYATPPVGIDRTGEEATDPTYFTARYLGRDVSGVRLQTRTNIDGLAGLYTTTVWQDSTVRDRLVRDLITQSLTVSGAILLALAIIVWFGVGIGLRPLLDLEDAIARRSSDDLASIKRRVPHEVTGIVGRLNALFGQLSASLQAQSDFIANAAHQLRNPLAGVLALAESVVSAKTDAQARARAVDLVKAARATTALSQKLLMLERAQAAIPAAAFQTIDLAPALRTWVDEHAGLSARAIMRHFDMPQGPVSVPADPVMLQEAVLNILDNAVAHAGRGFGRLDVRLERSDDGIVQMIFQDDGQGIAPEHIEQAMTRFVQLGDSGQTGLGLSIVRATVEGHGGQLRLTSQGGGLRVTLQLPGQLPGQFPDQSPVSGQSSRKALAK